MCYDVVAHTKKKIDYAIKRGWDEKSIAQLKEALEGLDSDLLPFYKVSGFEHPKLLCFSGDKPEKPEALEWGLIPHWVENEPDAAKIQNQTLNARIESLHEKPSFREAFKNQRCIVMVDGFYEHFHKNGKRFPYLIQNQDESPMILAGLWDISLNAKGEELKTVSIVTTKANEFMAEIHNNPKLEEPRMPLILHGDQVNDWLSNSDENELKQLQQGLIIPNEEIQLISHPVRPLKGKAALKNDDVKVLEPIAYPELQKGLFD